MVIQKNIIFLVSIGRKQLHFYENIERKFCVETMVWRIRTPWINLNLKFVGKQKTKSIVTYLFVL